MSADMATLPATRGGPKWSDILDQLWTRRIMQSPQMEVQRLISDHYGGRISIPLPEIDAEERPAVANIIAQVLDQHAMRIASVTPAKEVFPLRTGSQRDLKQARVQRRVLFDWDDNNAMNRFDRRRARWLVGFGQAPVLIRPNAVTRAPSWELRNPLGTYPTPVRPYDDMTPDDCIFTYVRTFGWLQQRYPNLSDVLNTTQPANRKYRADTRLEVIEYVDGEVLVLGVLGGGIVPPYALLAQMGYTVLPVPSNAAGQVYAIELERVANLAERCTAIIPNRITLDVLKGQLDDMIGIYQMEAKMMALQVNAVAQAIYPDTWFVEAPQGGGEIVTMADGLKGIVGHVRGGSIEQQGKPLGAQTMPVVATLERNAGMSGAATPEFSGESPSNVRTAQRGLNVTSNAIDFYIQEHQEILADAKTFEYEVAVAVDRAYFPKDKKSFYVAFGKEKGEVTYLPGELWKVAPKIKVRYNYAGLDANGIANLNGMKLGEGTKSKRAVMIEDPTITDVEEEEGRILEESINAGVLAGFNQQVVSGAVSVADAAEVQVLVSGGDYTLAEAILEQQKRAQVRQASSGPPGTPAGPVPPGSPEAQQGLQAGPQGAAQPVQGPNPSQVNLKQLIQNLAGNSAAARG